MSDERPKNSAGQLGKYACTRCGWKWTPRGNSPDPPHACARCRSAYWQTAPVSARANSPDNPKWQAERDVVALRKRERHLVRLRELAAEFDFTVPVGEGPRLVETPGMSTATIPPAKDAPRPTVDPRIRFNDPDWPMPTSGLATPSVRPQWRQTWDKT
jgi:hypothetical protein